MFVLLPPLNNSMCLRAGILVLRQQVPLRSVTSALAEEAGEGEEIWVPVPVPRVGSVESCGLRAVGSFSGHFSKCLGVPLGTQTLGKASSSHSACSGSP